MTKVSEPIKTGIARGAAAALERPTGREDDAGRVERSATSDIQPFHPPSLHRPLQSSLYLRFAISVWDSIVVISIVSSLLKNSNEFNR